MMMKFIHHKGRTQAHNAIQYNEAVKVSR